MSINKVLLERSPYLHTTYGCSRSAVTELNRCNRNHLWLTKPRIFPNWTFTEESLRPPLLWSLLLLVTSQTTGASQHEGLKSVSHRPQAVWFSAPSYVKWLVIYTPKAETEDPLTLKSFIQYGITHLNSFLWDTYHVPGTIQSADLPQLIWSSK